MGENGAHAGGRYGVWGINPYGPIFKRTPGIEFAINRAEGVSNLFSKKYANEIERAKARLANETLDSEILAKNTKNQTDVTNYPLQQAAITSQEQQKINEIMSRTDLNKAEKQRALAMAFAEGQRGNLYKIQGEEVTNPTLMFDTYLNKLKSTKPGTPENEFYKRAVNNMLNGMPPPNIPSQGNKGKKTTSPLSGLFPGSSPLSTIFQPGAPMSNMELNPLQGGSRSGYHQAAGFDESGNPITLESPTQSSATRNQMRKESEAESKFISPTVLSGINNYQGAFPTLGMFNDILNARFSKGTKRGDEANNRLYQYSLASRFVPEMTAINARQATGQAPGIEVLKEFKDSMFPFMPMKFAGKFIPEETKIAATNAYPGLQQQLASTAINQERTGYQEPGQAPWANTNPYPNGYVDDYGNYITPEEISQMFPSQKETPQIPSDQLSQMAQEAIAKGADPEAVKQRLAQLQGGQ